MRKVIIILSVIIAITVMIPMSVYLRVGKYEKPTPESEDNCARMAVQQVIDYLENGNIRNSVNLPAAVMERSGDTRVCVIHRNIAGILSKISTAVADTGLNIENMLNKSKGDFAYTMLDTMGAVSKEALDQIAAVDGIISVRVIAK